ncbi:methyltransferase domain-containing protein [candidate division KSB1 bacterium]|nr:methyltransferase domain-containing protein [candidate division KSB1 bacterium]
MKAIKQWRPSKFLLQKNALKIGPALPPHSWIMGDLLGKIYSKTIKEYVKGVLIDLGCGNAPLYVLYRYYADEIICVDWQKSTHDTIHADLFCDLNSEIALADQSADTILCTDVIEHLYHPHKLFSEISRILIPGGKAIIGTPFLYWLHEEPHDYFRYSPFILKHLCDQHQLKIIRLEAYGGSIHVFLDMIVKHFSFSKVCSKIIAWLCRMILYVPGIAKLSDKTAKKFPLGHILVTERR